MSSDTTMSELKKQLGKQTVTVSHESDHVYVNCVMYNDTTDSVPMKFEQTFTQPIIKNAQDYHLAIVRFDIPGADTPIIYPWPGDDFYSITLSYSGDDYQAYIELIPTSSSADAVWQYQQFINMMNVAFQTCFDALIADHAGVASVAPYATFDPATQLISLNFQTEYESLPIDTYFNFNLSQLFNSYDTFVTFAPGPNLKEVNIIVRDEKDNHITIEDSVTLATTETKASPAVTSVALFTADLVGSVVSGAGVPFGTIVSSFEDTSNITLSNAVTVNGTNDLTYLKQLPGYRMTQSYSTLFFWNSLQSIAFITKSLPVRNELINPISVSEGSSTADGTRLILNDFEPVNSPLSAGNFRSYFQYQPSTYRWTDMVGSSDVSIVDFSIYWTDNPGNFYPMSLDPNESFTVKLMFRKGLITTN